MMSIRSLTDFIESVSWSVPWLVELPPSPVRGHCGWILNEGWGLFLATSGDFSWPPAETSVGHQWILSHGHGHHRTPKAISIRQGSMPQSNTVFVSFDGMSLI